MDCYSEEALWEQINQLSMRCLPKIAKTSICLYVWNEERLKVAGTGVLLRIADRHFILSAAHVIDLTFYHKMLFYTSHLGEAAIPFPLLFKTRDSSARSPNLDTTDPNLRHEDPYDFSLAELQQETVVLLRHSHQFISVHDLDPTPIPIASGILVYGFPELLSGNYPDSEHETDSYPMHYITTPLQCEPEQRDKNKDILLYYSKNTHNYENGQTENRIVPKGISGCGIWRVSQPPKLPSDTHPDEMRLVGIQHRWRSKSNYLVGTSVHRILRLLWDHHPDLRGALRLILP